jgi:hypothetical protein
VGIKDGSQAQNKQAEIFLRHQGYMMPTQKTATTSTKRVADCAGVRDPCGSLLNASRLDGSMTAEEMVVLATSNPLVVEAAAAAACPKKKERV